MKRERDYEIDHRRHDHHQSIAKANCLVMLSKVVTTNTSSFSSFCLSPSSTPNQMFECKTCNRQFASFQALGGHRASHKKLRMTMMVSTSEEAKENNNDNNNNDDVPTLHNSSSSLPSMTSKPNKTHECSICGLEFAIGQALGGHMRRHIVPSSTCSNNNNNNNNNNDHNLNENLKIDSSMSTSMSNNSGMTSVEFSDLDQKKKKNFLIDLNLMPWENDSELLRIEKATSTTPLVDCFY